MHTLPVMPGDEAINLGTEAAAVRVTLTTLMQSACRALSGATLGRSGSVIANSTAA
jgi:hypothetical protein